MTQLVNLLSKLSISAPLPIRIDFKELRKIRQCNNTVLACKSIINRDTININKNELIRTLVDIEMTSDEFHTKCENDKQFLKLAAGRLSICSSRQGSLDEQEQLRVCNQVSEKYGINISKLSSVAVRPTKNGKIITNKEKKKDKITNDMCLKSFDGKISGKINGFITAKVAFGSGGHQDNVFAELDTMASWWEQYMNGVDDMLLILCDTDYIESYNRLVQKYEKTTNIKIINHYDFQKYIIENYKCDCIS